METTKIVFRFIAGIFLVCTAFVIVATALIKFNALNQILGTPTWVGATLTTLAIVVAVIICTYGANLVENATK